MFTDTIECPRCGEELEATFQTKSLNKSMRTYHVGEEIDERDLDIKEGRIRNATTSHQCEDPDRGKIEELLMNSMAREDYDEIEENIEDIRREINKSIRLKGDIVIEDGKFKGVENVMVK